MGAKGPKAVCVADICQLMEGIAPGWLAESWDNCGLQVGDPGWTVKKVWVALDPLLSVIESAARGNVDLVITHHPLIFKPLRKVDLDTIEGKIISIALTSRTAIYAAHTNLDSARDGVNEVLARKIGLTDLCAMMPADKNDGPKGAIQDIQSMGIGRIGALNPPATLADLVQDIKIRLGLKRVRVTGAMDRLIQKVAVCSGSGGGLLNDFLASDADVFITGDIRYHDARNVEASQRALIDVGHFASEHLIIDPLCRQLSQAVRTSLWDVRIEPCRLEQDPFEFV